MKKFFKRLGKFFLYFTITILAIFLVIVGSIWGYQQYKNYRLAQYIKSLPKDPTYSTDIIVELYGDEKIGDDQLTIREKVELGLNPYVLDTSGNGVPDWEAIHTYYTDPTKFSTAEDGISDLAKILEGLDPREPINSNSIESFTISDEELGVFIHTNDLNVKYHTFIEPYRHKELDAIYQPVREPVQFFHFDGEAEIQIPSSVKNIEDLKAFYFDFEKQEFKEIAKQRVEGNSLFVTIDHFYPVYILDPHTFEEIEEYYYFRVSLFQLGRIVVGYDHLVFLFKRGAMDSETANEEMFEDSDYGITKLTTSTIGAVSAAILDRVFEFFDEPFQPLDQTEGSVLKDALFGYGKINGTPAYVREYVIPWSKKEDIETENEHSWKVIDTGFRPEYHTFSFGNMMTVVADGGICAGYSRIIDRIYNGYGLELQMEFTPETLRGKLWDWQEDGKLSTLSYDLTSNLNHYAFIESGYLNFYSFTDDKISHLGKTTYVDDIVIDPDTISEPDQQIIRMLETQWAYANENIIYKTKPYETNNITILDQLEETLSQGKIVYVTLHGKYGHALNAYKMEFDRYDPNLIRLYVFDGNFPYGRLKKEGKEELYINIYKRKKKTLFGEKEYFEFDYTPFERLRERYSYSSVNGKDEIRFYVNDEPLTGISEE